MNNLSKLKISSYLAVIFLAGAVAGAVGGFKAGRGMMFSPPRSTEMAARVCDELESKLNLDPVQAKKIGVIINDGMAQFQAALGTEIMTTISNCNVRVMVELTPEQQVKFAELQKEHERFLKRDFNGPPGDSSKNP